ncbi:MAG: hypothetical protein Q8853_02820, partial [Candidatus Phytoplasma australasiaticum]|nr:hypothetical protein [Candidatus Phytoplasma australasiaticum]
LILALAGMFIVWNGLMARKLLRVQVKSTTMDSMAKVIGVLLDFLGQAFPRQSAYDIVIKSYETLVHHS